MTAKKKSTTAKVSKVKEIPEMVESDIVALYMEYVLEHERFPKSVYKFCKDIGIEETLFYQFFGSFESLQKSIWNQFFDLTINLSNKNENYAGFSNREKLLTFFYTMFELLTANRSYVLFVLKEQSNQDFMKRMNQFKGLKKRVKGFAATLIQHENMNKHSMIGRNPVTVFSEGAWLQFVFLLRFWIKDDSAGFEKTDVAIEKSVNTVFEVFNTKPLESILDFGKFLWRESTHS